jgi:hypothetical protein
VDRGHEDTAGRWLTRREGVIMKTVISSPAVAVVNLMLATAAIFDSLIRLVRRVRHPLRLWKRWWRKPRFWTEQMTTLAEEGKS